MSGLLLLLVTRHSSLVTAVLKRAALATALLAAAAWTAAAQSALPQLDGAVNDLAGVIDAGSRQRLERLSDALQRATGDVLVVAVVPTMAPYGSIEEYAVRLFENNRRGIGFKGQDNGILIVAALAERKVRIEVGYGLEEVITDGFAGETIRARILPRFREQQYGGGLYAGAAQIAQRIAEFKHASLELPAPLPRSSGAGRSPRLGDLGFLLFLLLFLGPWILPLLFAGTRRRYWGGGSWSGWNSGVGRFGGGGPFGGFGGGGAFGGFGGGRSGGGGASGSW